MTTPEESDQSAEWTWLARIRRTQGRKGEVFADILTDFPEKFAERKRLWLLPEEPPPVPEKSGLVSGHDFSRADRPKKMVSALAPAVRSLNQPREAELIAQWQHKGGIVLHFAGIDSITSAEALAGLIVAIPREQRAKLDEDEVYVGDLIGCTLMNVSGVTPTAIGEIEDVDRTAGPVALLVVRGSGGEILIPFAKAYLRKVDLEGKQVEMALPEGLVDLNS